MTVSDNSRTALQPQTGVTLVEVLVVLLIISVGMVATAKFQADLLHEGGTNKARIQALSHSVDRLENLRINHATAAGGDENITGINAEYALAWTVGGFAGDAQRYETTITWIDSKNRNQSLILGSVVYPDNLYTDPDGATGCLVGDCSEPPPPPPPPDVDIELGDPEVLIVDENWPGITDPEDDTTGNNGTNDDDKIYKSGHISSPFDLGDGDDILYINGQIKSELYAGGGDDQIETTGNVKSKVYLEEGDDAFKTHGHLQDEIDGGSGNDVIIIGKHLQSKAYLGSGNDKLTIGQHVQDEVYADSGHDYVFVGGQVKNKIHMDSGDDFVVITGSISDPIYGGSGNDSLCLLGYSSSNWNGVDQSSFENIKTSDGVIVKGSGDNFGTGCDYSSSWIGGSSGDYLYSYPVSLTITPQGGLDQVATITLVNEIPDTEVEADPPDVIDNGDGTFTVLVSNDKAVFNLFTNELFDVSDLTTEQTNEWVDNEQSVTVTLKEQP